MKTLGAVARIDSRRAAKVVLINAKEVKYNNVAHDVLVAVAKYRMKIYKMEGR